MTDGMDSLKKLGDRLQAELNQAKADIAYHNGQVRDLEANAFDLSNQIQVVEGIIATKGSLALLDVPPAQTALSILNKIVDEVVQSGYWDVGVGILDTHVSLDEEEVAMVEKMLEDRRQS